MARRGALKRLLVAAVYIPLYVVLSPIGFAIAVIAFLLDAGFTALTGRRLTRGPNIGRRFWKELDRGMIWVLTDEPSSKPTWMP